MRCHSPAPTAAILASASWTRFSPNTSSPAAIAARTPLGRDGLGDSDEPDARPDRDPRGRRPRRSRRGRRDGHGERVDQRGDRAARTPSGTCRTPADAGAAHLRRRKHGISSSSASTVARRAAGTVSPTDRSAAHDRPPTAAGRLLAVGNDRRSAPSFEARRWRSSSSRKSRSRPARDSPMASGARLALATSWRTGRALARRVEAGGDDGHLDLVAHAGRRCPCRR